MFKFISFLLKKLFYILLVQFLFTQYLSATPEIPPDIKRIISRGKIIVALKTGNYPPFFYEDEKKILKGYDIDIAQDIAKNLGVSLEFNRSANSFADVIKLVENDSADLAISAISSTLSRGISVNFSEPYLFPNQSLIVNRLLEIKIRNNTDVDKEFLKIAVLKNSAYEDYVKNNLNNIDVLLKNATIVKYDDLESALTDVINGKILSLFVDEIYANYIIKNRKLANIYVRRKIIEGELDPISIVVNWRNPHLLNWVNLYVNRMKYDGRNKYLSQKYLKEIK
ncbi:ABC transporter substrate-binding protein [Fluviispira sanaruensis]|uniref:Amino acid ABC transporter substrate-binding protein n=1 Tax=Fluviispira sanaruensis TaxID=2493639 RepID=A0A4P2VJA3_FLUSA|nr:ABC transporter substrate-binding protein [Fluviispira sanaruensis]BBH52751.1 amino acid ABC transporter substrate-binding protein [Fluviispira sanaruensis]